MTAPRELTDDEMIERLLQQFDATARYCAKDERTPDIEDKIRLAIFSVLVTLEGGTLAFPGCDIVPLPHADDEAFQRQRGENWFPSKGRNICDGELHSRWAKRKGR